MTEQPDMFDEQLKKLREKPPEKPKSSGLRPRITGIGRIRSNCDLTDINRMLDGVREKHHPGQGICDALDEFLGTEPDDEWGTGE